MKYLTNAELQAYKTKYPKFSVINYTGTHNFALAYYHEGLEENCSTFFDTEEEATEEYKRLKNGKYGKFLADVRICHRQIVGANSKEYYTMYYIED